MLAAHMDVVPIDGKWVQEPFGGKIIGNIIYGRGAIDNKNAVMVNPHVTDLRVIALNLLVSGHFGSH